MSNKILTLHPEGKQGVNIDLDKYEQMKNAILQALTDLGPMSFTDLSKQMGLYLEDFQGSVMWYFTTVKLDLEARGMVKRAKKGGNQLVLLNEG